MLLPLENYALQNNECSFFIRFIELEEVHVDSATLSNKILLLDGCMGAWV